jgi:LmbE family N-acetylglucosaminyl deacetylase
MTENILVVAAHPDDEVLGMGGTIARHTAQGDRVFVLFLTDGVGARGGKDDDALQRRREAAESATELLGAEIVAFHDFPDNELDTVPLLALVKAIEDAKKKVSPQRVYTHHGGDLNIDHRRVSQAVLTAFRPQPGESCREIFAFEVNSSTEWSAPSVTTPFLPDTYIDISKQQDTLRAACQSYAEEMREAPHTRSIDSVLRAAKHRGSQVGLDAAEAFVTLRRIID